MRSAIGTIVKRTIKIASAYVAIAGTVAPDTLITGQCGESAIGFSEQQFGLPPHLHLLNASGTIAVSLDLKFSPKSGFFFGVLSLNVNYAR